MSMFGTPKEWHNIAWGVNPRCVTNARNPCHRVSTWGSHPRLRYATPAGFQTGFRAVGER